MCDGDEVGGTTERDGCVNYALLADGLEFLAIFPVLNKQTGWKTQENFER
jgi:hypothetical protein